MNIYHQSEVSINIVSSSWSTGPCQVLLYLLVLSLSWSLPQFVLFYSLLVLDLSFPLDLKTNDSETVFSSWFIPSAQRSYGMDLLKIMNE